MREWRGRRGWVLFGVARSGVFWIGLAGKVRSVMAGRGKSGFGRQGTLLSGTVGHGGFRCSEVRLGRRGLLGSGNVSSGMSRCGLAGKVWQCMARSVTAGRVEACFSRQGLSR